MQELRFAKEILNPIHPSETTYAGYLSLNFELFDRLNALISSRKHQVADCCNPTLVVDTCVDCHLQISLCILDRLM
jgi:hypothetical protein